eukprot:TRINITY_DN2554_c0_g1_i1.p2 TRINITY_DN2554_c0_g1~~TRINITY_DN2554_c0_g1_i1.p2  ORF type:complete len:79 (-),score=9.26 TRINITY_DN2554_c0_g1_i1:109-345(-)
MSLEKLSSFFLSLFYHNPNPLQGKKESPKMNKIRLDYTFDILATRCAERGISIDLFSCTNTYVDLATIADLMDWMERV